MIVFHANKCLNKIQLITTTRHLVNEIKSYVLVVIVVYLCICIDINVSFTESERK